MTRPQLEIPVMGRVVGAVAGFVFAAIGLTVIGFLWLADDGFGSPPLFFRIFGSLVAIVFVLVGGSAGLASLTANPRLPNLGPLQPDTPPPAGPIATGPFACPHCGAAMTGRAEASPHGDVKCPHCGAWFNIHGRA